MAVCSRSSCSRLRADARDQPLDGQHLLAADDKGGCRKRWRCGRWGLLYWLVSGWCWEGNCVCSTPTGLVPARINECHSWDVPWAGLGLVGIFILYLMVFKPRSMIAHEDCLG